MASLFAALQVSVAGLNAQSQAIGNISDNLSNAQTTGFKSIGTEFQDLVTASSASTNSPGGVRALPQYQNDVQGTIASSATSTNLAISGQGFFEVTTASTNASGATSFSGSTNYTRAGDFSLDKDGFLVNGAGYYLLGFPISQSGQVNTTTSTEVQISALLDDPVPTSQVQYNANLPSNAATNFTSTASDVNIFDALGNTHQMSITWVKTGTNAWTASVDVANGLGTGTDYTANIPITFNSSTPTGTISTVGASTASPAAYSVIPGSTTAGVSFNLTFPGAGTQAVNFDLGSYNTAGGTTQFSDPNGVVSVSSIQQDGLPQGSFNNISIDSGGTVSINYSNGSNRKIYQIPIVMFNSPDNLQRISGGAYQSTLAAGAPNLFSAGSNGAGTISSSSLEQSNVDIAEQFTTMIQAQQVYSANAKTVTTVNHMLDTIINAIQ